MREPMYLKTVFSSRWACRAPKASGDVVAASPNFGIFETVGRTAPMRGSAVAPSSMRKLTTAIDLSVCC